MSDPVRIALVAEGPTDGIVIKAVARSILGSRTFVLTQLQPEESAAFGPTGTGWAGVYRWCKQTAEMDGGVLGVSGLLFQSYDIVVVHLDADVASQRYEWASIAPAPSDKALPCNRPCPPASATCDEVRQLLLSWCGAVAPLSGVVFCVPSMNTEAWVLAALFPCDTAVTPLLECFSDPETRLSQQRKSTRIRKSRRAYQAREADIASAWPRLASAGGLEEAARFNRELSEALHTPSS